MFRDHDHVVDAIAFSTEKADKILEKYLTDVTASDKGEGGVGDSETKSKEKGDGKTAGGAKANKEGGKEGATHAYTPQFIASASRDKTIKIFHITSGVRGFF